MTNIEELREECRKLLSLLDDPQPGLFAWNSFLHDQLKVLSRLLKEAEEN